MIIKNKKKKIIIIVISIILLFLIIIASVDIYKDYKSAKELEQIRQTVQQYSSIKQFNNIQEVSLYLNCELIEVEELEKEELKYNVYMKITNSPNDSGAQQYYENLLQYSAYVLKYENFYLIDKEQNIEILVVCNKEKELVTTYYINGNQNYFSEKQTQNEINNSKKIETIEVQIQSQVLVELINNNWVVNEKIGTVESEFNKYSIYFDEGFEIRRINNKVFNIVFNEKYKENIINNLTTSNVNNEIIKQLGNPQFQVSNIIGYKCENIYIFFNNGEVSIYPNEQYSTDNIINTLIQHSQEKDIEKTIMEIKNLWKDYDLYEYTNNSIILQYSLKGISFIYGIENKNGVYLYNNYTGNVTENETLNEILENKLNLPENIYYSNLDLVFETEIKRIQNKYDSAYNIPSDIILNTSLKFKIVYEENGGLYSIKIISIDEKYPNSELNVDITKGIWFDDTNFIYAIKNRGIYLYNAENRTYKTIKQLGDKVEEFNIKDIDEDNLYYDDTYIKIEL